jgi:hypothetical protein
MTGRYRPEVPVTKMNISGLNAKQDALGPADRQKGDTIDKMMRYLTQSRKLPRELAAEVLAGAIDDCVGDETETVETADDLLARLRQSGLQGRSPAEIAETLAHMIDGGEAGSTGLDEALRKHVDARLAALKT